MVNSLRLLKTEFTQHRSARLFHGHIAFSIIADICTLLILISKSGKEQIQREVTLSSILMSYGNLIQGQILSWS
jgi:hypothetical protein